MKGYALSEKYIQRETFAFMVRNLYRLKHFQQTLMETVKQIAQDPIPIVRIALAISLKEIIEKDP